ncbi:MAG TPA: fibronectin type III domain-containing protein [Solirubrobacteraceae bacterium]|nr:fibronectin type III domain-containing protein [Solirubrobacteraceae bacterium]
MSVTVPCSGTGGGAAGLAAAIVSADIGGGGTITLTAGCNYSFTVPYANTGSQDLADWYGPAALPAIAAPVTIVGNGATISRSTVSGTPAFRLFFVGASPSAPGTPSWTTPGSGGLVLENVTLSGGLALGGSGNGGGGGGGLGAGGAIYNQGVTVLFGVTMSGNTAHGGSAAGAGTGTGGGGVGADAASSASNTGGGFGTGFVAPSAASTGGLGLAGLGAGGGGAGFGTSENGAAGLVAGAGAGGGTLSGTAGDADPGSGAKGGNGGGGGSSALALTGANGGNYGAGGAGGAGGGAGGGGVGGGGGGGAAGAGGGFGGGGGYPGGEGGFGAGGAGGYNGTAFGATGNAGFGAGTGGSTAVGGGGAGMGGALFNQHGTVVAENATVSGNTAMGGTTGGSGASGGSGLGGGIFSLNGAVILVNNTIAANTADDGGATYLVGYDASSATTTVAGALVNNILSGSVTASSASTHDLVSAKPGLVADASANRAGATANASAPNIVVSNLASTGALTGTPLTADPQLGALAQNGGPGMATMLPGSASPALKAGTTTGAPTTDERGTARPAAGPIDLGAVQVSVASAAPASTAPVVLTGPAKSVTSSKATLTAAVNPNGSATTYIFQYGPSTNYGFKTSIGHLASGTAPAPVSANISNLKANTTYHFRIAATNAGGTSQGVDGTFKTARQAIAGLTVITTPRHAVKFPYRFKFTGKIRLPKGTTNGAACAGGVSFLIKRGKKTVLRGRTGVFVGCTWKFTAKLGKRKAVPGHGNLSVTVSFGGNTVLAPFTAKPFTIRYG